MEYPVTCKECNREVTVRYEHNDIVVCSWCSKPLPENEKKKHESTAVLSNKGGKRIFRS